MKFDMGNELPNPNYSLQFNWIHIKRFSNMSKQTATNRSVYVIGFCTARIFWLKRTAKWLAVRPAPALAGDPLLVSRFLPTREFCNRKVYPSTTASLQKHAPPRLCANATYRRTLAFMIQNGPIFVGIKFITT